MVPASGGRVGGMAPQHGAHLRSGPEPPARLISAPARTSMKTALARSSCGRVARPCPTDPGQPETLPIACPNPAAGPAHRRPRCAMRTALETERAPVRSWPLAGSKTPGRAPDMV